MRERHEINIRGVKEEEVNGKNRENYKIKIREKKKKVLNNVGMKDIVCHSSSMYVWKLREKRKKNT